MFFKLVVHYTLDGISRVECRTLILCRTFYAENHHVRSYLDLERLTRQQALLLQQQQRNRDSGFQLSSAHAIKSLHSTPNNMTPMMKYDPKYDPQQLSNYSDPQLYTSHNTFPDIDIGGSGTFQSHGNNSMMEFYEHHSQFAMRNSTNQNREPIRNNPNNHLDQSQVSVPTLLTSKRLDLLSEHPEKNLSQNLFNKNSYQVKKLELIKVRHATQSATH